MKNEDYIADLLKAAKKYYRKHGRNHLPWRKIRGPYENMVSEVMLQQTQVERVVPFYQAFIERFPTIRSLAAAELSEVLKLWSGLGYNRRGKMLRDAARMIVDHFGGTFPKNVADIESLPGIGPYTARAIAVFAYNEPEVFIETNIRTVFFYFSFLQKAKMISDTELLPFVENALKRSRMAPREFYAMLMDYGSFLKKSGIRLNTRSKHYAKQSKFEGSRRQLRGQILKLLLKKPLTQTAMIYQSGRTAEEVSEELAGLVKGKLVLQKKGKFYIAA